MDDNNEGSLIHMHLKKTEKDLAWPRSVILLHGSNPLPLVIVALAYGPGTTVHLVGTTGTKDRVERTTKFLKNAGLSVGEGMTLSNESDPCMIEKDLKSLFERCPADLLYSGGTKAMAVHGYSQWQKHVESKYDRQYFGLNLSASGYLHFSRSGIQACDLRFEPKLSLEDMFTLHLGVELKGTRAELIPENTVKIADRIAELCADGSADGKFGESYKNKLMPNVYGQHKSPVCVKLESSTASDSKKDGCPLEVYTQNKTNGLNLMDNGNFRHDSPLLKAYEPLSKLLLSCVDAQGVQTPLLGGSTSFDELCKRMFPEKKSIKGPERVDAAKFLYGDWLEVWLANTLLQMKDRFEINRPLFDEVYQDVKLGCAADVQLDVVAVRGARVFLFSCTVDSTKSLVKSKLMEARMRAEQLGGLLARYAVVSFNTDPDKILHEIKEEGFDGYNDARAFGPDAFQDFAKFKEALNDWVHA